MRRILLLWGLSLLLTGCKDKTEVPVQSIDNTSITDFVSETDAPTAADTDITLSTSDALPDAASVPAILDLDLSGYFKELKGSAVFFKPNSMTYYVHNKELWEVRRSPCSTFKIISGLTAFKNGVLTEDASTRKWSGETFWKADWNRDIDFRDAFKTSCVWYFRTIIDEIGKDAMQAELEALQYGNCDVTDWEGRLNTNNSNRALTGFWVESSLLISPKEQTEVMERIFGADSVYDEAMLSILREVMLSETTEDGTKIYGKTGFGKMGGKLADAWFVGVMEDGDAPLYFAVYLSENNPPDVSSADAKQIALDIGRDFKNIFY